MDAIRAMRDGARFPICLALSARTEHLKTELPDFQKSMLFNILFIKMFDLEREKKNAYKNPTEIHCNSNF